MNSPAKPPPATTTSGGAGNRAALLFRQSQPGLGDACDDIDFNFRTRKGQA